MGAAEISLQAENDFSQLDLADRQAVALAVSGGGDSLALLQLASRHAAFPRLVALTVDHGLRPEAAQEARMVAALCKRMRIEHRILRWDGAGGTGGVAARAREARYRLMADEAGKIGTDILLLGHTMDDQAETIAMRAARGATASFNRGGAGMARATLFDNRLWLVRPLLCCRRAALRRMLADNGIAWSEDPTNEDMRFERPRVRAGLSAGDEAEVPRLAKAALEAARARRRLAAAAAAILDERCALAAPGLARVKGGFAAPDAQAAAYALRLLLATIGGREQLPDALRVQLLLEALDAPRHRATLSRCVVEKWGIDVFVRRENRGLPWLSDPERGAIWDGRQEVTRAAGGQVTFGPRGAALAAQAAPDHYEAPPRLVRAALAAEPVAWSGGRPIDPADQACPFGLSPIVAPFRRFLPEFDLDAAAALSRLFGRPPPPASPWRHHNAG